MRRKWVSVLVVALVLSFMANIAVPPPRAHAVVPGLVNPVLGELVLLNPYVLGVVAILVAGGIIYYNKDRIIEALGPAWTTMSTGLSNKIKTAVDSKQPISLDGAQIHEAGVLADSVAGAPGVWAPVSDASSPILNAHNVNFDATVGHQVIWTEAFPFPPSGADNAALFVSVAASAGVVVRYRLVDVPSAALITQFDNTGTGSWVALQIAGIAGGYRGHVLKLTASVLSATATTANYFRIARAYATRELTGATVYGTPSVHTTSSWDYTNGGVTDHYPTGSRTGSYPGSVAIPQDLDQLKGKDIVAAPGTTITDINGVAVPATTAGTAAPDATATNGLLSTVISTITGIATTIQRFFDFSKPIDWSPLAVPVTDKFPFSIPWDVMGLFSLIDVAPKTPVIGSDNFLLGQGISFDLGPVDGLMAGVRWGELLVLVAGIALAVRKWMGGAT